MTTSPMHRVIRALTLTGILAGSLLGGTAIAQTPQAAGCAGIATPAAGMMDHGHGHGIATPGTMDHGAHMGDVEFDQMYIDMMIPHHESIMALAEVAVVELKDPRLVEIAQAIVDTQGPEVEELRQLRAEWYGSAEPMPMDDQMMGVMMEMMPGMGSMDEMMAQMSAEVQVQTFCAAADKDLTFIEQTIAHHQMAIHASEIALEQAVHPELKAIAEAVIAAQQAEIAELEAIRADLTSAATPAASSQPINNSSNMH